MMVVGVTEIETQREYLQVGEGRGCAGGRGGRGGRGDKFQFEGFELLTSVQEQGPPFLNPYGLVLSLSTMSLL